MLSTSTWVSPFKSVIISVCSVTLAVSAWSKALVRYLWYRAVVVRRDNEGKDTLQSQLSGSHGSWDGTVSCPH